MSSGKAGKRPLRSLTAHEKLDAIRRVHDGESKASVARDIGVPESTLRGWCKNEDKISYLSRQSSPETDESSLPSYEPKEKKLKLEESVITKMVTPNTGVIAPFNLSVKQQQQPLSYSTNDDLIKNNIVDCAKNSTPTSTTAPINLTTSSSAHVDASAKSNVTNGCMSEREKNRAELARLSVELGLDRPEMFLTGGISSIGGVADLSANISLLAHQWNNILQQQNNKSSTAAVPNKPLQSKVDATGATINQLLNYTKLLDNNTKKLPTVDPPKSVEDSVWCWLKTQQAMLGLGQNIQQNGTAIPAPSSMSTSVNNMTSNSTVSTTTPQISAASLPLKSGLDLNHSSWFWKWYKQYTTQLQTALIAKVPINKPILYQQLTKMNSENLETGDEAELLAANKSGISTGTPVAPAVSVSSATNNRSRSVLDNILLNNNNNVSTQKQKEGKEDYLSQNEALEHGEKFLRWLECCSEPSVTAMQIMQFRSLINNIRTSSVRKNGEQKTKVRRK